MDDIAAPQHNSAEKILVFDGVCNLCTFSIRFIHRNDRTKQLLFTTVQSDLGKQLLEKYGISSVDPETFLLVQNGQALQRSDAALAIARHLGPWRVLGIFRFIPRRLRDSIYFLLARNRYKWFGKREVCYLPTPDETERFIE